MKSPWNHRFKKFKVHPHPELSGVLAQSAERDVNRHSLTFCLSVFIALLSAASANGFQMVVGGSQAKALSDFQLINLQVIIFPFKRLVKKVTN